MGLFNWFRRLASGESVEAAAPPAGESGQGAELHGLNFMSAIDVHVKWKGRLEDYIRGSSREDLKAETICRDDLCPLGQWIYGPDGQQFGRIEAFEEMKRGHAHFHECAGKVLAAAQEGRKDEALRMLQQGDYVRASERVKMLLAKLYVQLAGRAKKTPEP